MENTPNFTPKIDNISEKMHEIRFQKLARNTSGNLIEVSDQKIKEVVPFIISYENKYDPGEETVRVYRGINHIPVLNAEQLPSILRRAVNVDQELLDLCVDLGNEPSEDKYNRIMEKNITLGNNDANYLIHKAKRYITETMKDYNNDDYNEGFKTMHFLENTASPFVSTSADIGRSLSYSMLSTPGMFIVADIPKSHINGAFSESYDKEIAVNGPIRQEYIKSVLLVSKRHSTQDKDFIDSVSKLIDNK